MILTLLSHQWKSFWRSRNAGKSLAIQVLLGFLIIYVLGAVLAMGLAFPHFLQKAFPGRDVIPVFCSLILYYFSVDLLIRFTFQELPVLSVQPYLGQNIRRRKLVTFLNVRSLFHFLNLIPLFLFLPFTFEKMPGVYGTAGVIGFVITIVTLVLFNHFLILFIKRKTIINSWWLLGFFAGIVALMALDYFRIISLRQLSADVFIRILSKPLLALIPVALGLGAWLNNYLFLLGNLYLDEGAKKEKGKTTREYSWLQQLGTTGELVALDIKLILRNKRPKYIARISILLLGYGLIFYTKENMKDSHLYMPIFGAMFVTGAFIFNYGQFLFAWHSSYFDGLLSSNIRIPLFIRSKFLLFTAVSTMTFIVSTLYGFISWKLIFLQLAAWLYNIGINSLISVYLATYSYKGIDLSKSATFNYQGTGGAQWIYALVIMLVPYLIYWPMAKYVSPWAGLLVIGGLGLTSLLLQNFWIGVLTREFEKRKYLILAGFREK